MHTGKPESGIVQSLREVLILFSNLQGVMVNLKPLGTLEVRCDSEYHQPWFEILYKVFFYIVKRKTLSNNLDIPILSRMNRLSSPNILISLALDKKSHSAGSKILNFLVFANK